MHFYVYLLILNRNFNLEFRARFFKDIILLTIEITYLTPLTIKLNVGCYCCGAIIEYVSTMFVYIVHPPQPEWLRKWRSSCIALRRTLSKLQPVVTIRLDASVSTHYYDHCPCIRCALTGLINYSHYNCLHIDTLVNKRAIARPHPFNQDLQSAIEHVISQLKFTTDNVYSVWVRVL